MRPRARGKRREMTCKDWLDNIADTWESDACILFPFYVGNHGYGRLSSNGEGWLAHRYICTKIYGPAPTKKHDAAHSCGNKLCMNKRHLRWATRAENEADKKAHGRDNRGSRHGMSKLTAEQVRAIRGARMAQKTIAHQYGISRATVSDLKRKRRWTHLD